MGILTIIQNDSRKSKFESNLAIAVYSYICGRKALLLSLLSKPQFQSVEQGSQFYGVKGENTETASNWQAFY